MKNRILHILAVIMIVQISQAQMIYGPKIGLNTSRLPNDKMMPGFHVGGFVNAEIMDRIGLQVDFLWALKGNKNESTISTSTNAAVNSTVITTTTYYRFIEVPVAVYFPISQHIRGFLGPQFNYLRKAHKTVDTPNSTIESDFSGVGKPSLIAGFDFVFDSDLTLGLRFVSNKYSTTSIVGPDGEENENVSRLNSVMITAGYKLDW